MLDNTGSAGPSSSSDAITSFEQGACNKRRRRPAGTPDPDAEVVSLSPKTLLESDRYVCEICNQGFQRDQNLQMHRRRHKVPWKLLKRESSEVKKRVFVCPEPTCLHHDPSHALGDLVGIKKHYRRKHSNHKQWVCEKCSKGYAVQSDYKAHLKTCGTRGHSCDCGRVFSRVESFIEHQDACTAQRGQAELLSLQPEAPENIFFRSQSTGDPINPVQHHNLELQLLPSSILMPQKLEENHLKLSIGSCSRGKISEVISPDERNGAEPTSEASRLRELASEQLRLAMAEKAFAEAARQEAKRHIEIAEQEFANAKRMRQQARSELENAQALKEQATRKINSTILEITCHSCKQQFQASVGVAPSDETSLANSYMSSATTEGDGEQ
ncbi:zinc finger protein SHOOT GRAVITROPISM 5-like [Malania oleifera]|uniref:zinc finger protein SHOOT GRAVITROPISM 5-like n=1 Tax=Malania oleifera TaxID=397392 RepID=UPI0025ADE69D|nr:zinc finger protein SHOOT GRAVITROPISM 5-like [Malania oleifera]XP_057961306.1 zinc finger protein SHOOT GRAVITROPISM 5-like [Malania oleifera]